MSGNAGSTGSHATNPKPDRAVVMAHFDQLPPVVRAAIREAALDWDTVAIAGALARGFNPHGLPAYIADFERKHMARPE